ncbi:uncharacterized protein LOC127738559 isoform X1 [Mytilus californianus]|uniref:uncharacterized protein LOC127738559 isoform X1 n=1 Tax=Mytilus californianus TaxID=6549 RepID=UPI0022472D0C|nr:uncharacterized protein LOC127738559 isoform X1 [Mytilus californianus]
MSSLLTAFRISQMRKAEIKRKEKAAEKKRMKVLRRERKEQQQARLYEESQIDNNNPISNPVDIPEAQYLPPDQDGEPATKIWTFLLDEEPYSIVFYKDTLDVYLNGEEMDCLNNFPDDDASDATVDFCVGAHKARISLQSAGCSNATVNQMLTIDGIPVPE